MGGGKGGKHKRLPASPADDDDFLGGASSKGRPSTSGKADLPVGSRGAVSAALAGVDAGNGFCASQADQASSAWLAVP